MTHKITAKITRRYSKRPKNTISLRLDPNELSRFKHVKAAFDKFHGAETSNTVFFNSLLASFGSMVPGTPEV